MVEVGESKDLDSLMCYKGKWQRNHGLSQSKDLDFGMVEYHVNSNKEPLSLSSKISMVIKAI